MRIYLLLVMASILAACAIPYVDPFPVDAGTAQWRDRAIRGL